MKVNVTELVIRLILTFGVFGLVLFLPAGTIDWPSAWVYLVLLFRFTIGISIWLSRLQSRTSFRTGERLGRTGHKRWDKVFLALLLPFFFGWYVVMALDAVRFKWSEIPDWLQWIGAGVLLASFYIFYLTFRENTIYRRQCASRPKEDRRSLAQVRTSTCDIQCTRDSFSSHSAPRSCLVPFTDCQERWC